MIRLHGILANKYGKKIDIEVTSIGECIRALGANFGDEFKQIIREGQFYVFAGKKNLNETQLKNTYKKDFTIIPVAVGSGKGGGGFFVVAGVAMLVIAYIFPITAPVLQPLGIATLSYGLSLLLSPDPPGHSDKKIEDRPSYLFDGPSNEREVGIPIPMPFGFDVWIGGTIISAGIKIQG